MDTAVINIRTQASVKEQLQRVAEELGLTVSALINGLIKQVIRTKRVEFSTREEIPSPYMIKMLKESEEDIKKGRVSPAFDNADDTIAWLENPHPKYANKL